MAHNEKQAPPSCQRAANLAARYAGVSLKTNGGYPQPARSAAACLPTRLLGLLIVIVLSFLSTFLYDQARARSNLRVTDLAPLEMQTAQRLLVIAPHPDDEILAAGGLMQKVLSSGGEVGVVIVTNGDGQFLSPLLVHPLSAPHAADYIDFGLVRQNETLTALGHIGVSRNKVVFLGYPDGRVGELWNRAWPNAVASIAPYTRASSSPYQNTFNPFSSYRGGDLFNDLLTNIANFQPDIVLVPHPEDTHPDHSAVSDFARFAIAVYLASGEHPEPTVLAYLVHYARYPIPRGEQTGRELLPPAALASGGDGWVTYALSLTEIAQKKAALNAYKSQLRSMGSYLRSFIRANEIFYHLPAVEMPFAGYEGDKLLEEGLQTDFNYTEPARERASRVLFSSADLVSWRAARLGGLICFGAEIRGKASSHINYIIRAKLPDGSNLRVSQPDDLIWFADQHFGACFDLTELGNPAAVGFSAETRNRNILVDRTAWRFVHFTNPVP
jgi:LmbE family N-acetylglucosaminyl deacetylase